MENKEKQMKNLRKKKRFVTLVEMMIVMFLIAMIVGVIAYNYTGSLDEGKAFKTKTGMEKIHTILDLHLAANPNDREVVEARWREFIKDSQLVKNANDLIKDGWGSDYQVTLNTNQEIEIRSDRYEKYLNSKGKGSLFQQEKNHS